MCLLCLFTNDGVFVRQRRTPAITSAAGGAQARTQQGSPTRLGLYITAATCSGTLWDCPTCPLALLNRKNNY